jgi:hypothetical protein
MKYIATIAVILFAVLPAQAQSTETETSDLPKPVFGIKTGFNISQLSASFNSESKPKVGMHLGIFLRVPITEEAYFRPELYYSSQGQKDDYISPSTKQSVGTTTTQLNYMNIPLVLEYGKKFSFQIGAQLGILLSATEKGTINNQKVDDDLKEIMRSTEFGFLLGFGVSPGKHFNAGVRYNLGVSDIFSADEDAGVTDFPAVRNRMMHFYLGYSF